MNATNLKTHLAMSVFLLAMVLMLCAGMALGQAGLLVEPHPRRPGPAGLDGEPGVPLLRCQRQIIPAFRHNGQGSVVHMTFHTSGVNGHCSCAQIACQRSGISGVYRKGIYPSFR